MTGTLAIALAAAAAQNTPVVDPTEQARQLYRQTHRTDESRLERVTILVASPTGGRGYEVVFEGPKGFIDAVTPCRTGDMKGAGRHMIFTGNGDVEELRLGAPLNDVGRFATCVAQHSGLVGS